MQQRKVTPRRVPVMGTSRVTPHLVRSFVRLKILHIPNSRFCHNKWDIGGVQMNERTNSFEGRHGYE